MVHEIFPASLQEEIAFRNVAVTLKGTLTKPKESVPCAVVIVAHTSHGGTREYPVYRHLVTTLPQYGVAVLLFDRRGSGESTGDFETATFFDLASDIQAANNYLKTRGDIDADRIGVWGMSQGGWTAPLAASMSTDITFVIAVSAAGVSPASQMLFSAKSELVEHGFSTMEIDQMLELQELMDEYYRGNVLRYQVQEQVNALHDEAWFSLLYGSDSLPPDPTATKWYREMDYDPVPVMQKLNVPILLIYGEQDPWIPIPESVDSWQQYGPKEMTIRRIRDANHFMVMISQAGTRSDTGPQAEEYIATLVDWISGQLCL